MSQILNLKIRGLVTNKNSLDPNLQDGALTIASNIDIVADDQAQSRRGFTALASLNSVSDRVDSMTSYQDKLIVHRSNDNKMAYYNASTWNDYSGTYLNPDSDYARMRFIQMNSNLYFTTSAGVNVLDAYNNPIATTGMPRGLDGSGSTTGASGFMATNTQVAYRIVWGARDANNNLYLGSPSQRIIVSNSSGGTRDVSLTFTIPSGLTTSDFYQIYRSRQSASSSTEPDDELQQVYEGNPTSGQITALSITLTDSRPDSLKGAYLYSNANQEGISESNDIPPLAKDICVFKNFMFFAGIQTKHYLDIKLLAVGGSSGIAINDTITINGMVFTGKASTTVANREFMVSTGGSASQNIDDTAKSLIQVINQYSSNTSIYAYYESGYSDLPGQILLEARTVSGSQFSVSVSRAAAWNIDDGISDNTNYQNGVMWSKIQQPEHVPSSHLELVGSKAHPIRRILALRDALFILKTDGVWRLTGDNGQWRIEPLDTSTKIIAPESAVILNNQIYALTDQGVVAISDMGVQVISRPIEDRLTYLIGSNYSGLKTLSFGMGYETDRKYVLFTVSNASDTNPVQAFVYNTFTSAWTTYSKSVKTGLINPTDDKIYLAPVENKVLKERKVFDFSDFADEERTSVSYSVISSSGTTVVLNTVTDIQVGDLLTDNSSKYSPITAIDYANTSVTVNDTVSWSVGSISVLKGISCELEWINQTGGNPAIEKHWQEAQVFFKSNQFMSAQVGFYTDISGGYTDCDISGQFGGGAFGSFAWGNGLPWGGILRAKPQRILIPREKSRSTIITPRFKCTNAYSKWVITGFAVFFEQVSERANR